MASGRQRSAHQAPLPGLATRPVQRLQALLAKSRKDTQMGGAALWLSEQTKQRNVREQQKLLEKQQVTYEVLIDRFGPEVGLTLDLHYQVADGMASEAEIEEYQKKSDAMTKLVQKFYREFDVAAIENVDDRDLNVLIAMLSTGFAVTQNQTKEITKVLNNKSLTTRLAGAMAGNEVSLSGFVGSSESTEALSPQQQVTTLGLDYEYKQNTDFLLNTQDRENPAYVPIPQTTYIKVPYTPALKRLTQMTLDVRFYDKILERAERTAAEGDFFSLKEEVITEMAKEISQRPVTLKYKISKGESDEKAKEKSALLGKKHKEKHGDVKADQPPFTGLGFSAYGERIGSGFMNLYPEMNLNVKLNQGNFKTLLGEDARMEFYAKFAKTDQELNAYNPEGSTDVLVGKWDGSEVTIPVQSQEEYDANFERVKSKFLGNKSNADSLDANKFSHAKVDSSVKSIKEAKLAEQKKKHDAEKALSINVSPSN